MSTLLAYNFTNNDLHKHIINKLYESGVHKESETYKALSSEPMDILISGFLIAAGLLLGFSLSFLGAALAVAGVWTFSNHFLGRQSLFAAFIPKKSFTNISGHILGENNRHIIILTKGYEPADGINHLNQLSFRRFLIIYFCINLFSIPWAYLGEYHQGKVFYLIISLSLILVQVCFMSYYLWKRKPGEQREFSGISILLDLIDRMAKTGLKKFNIHFLISDGRERGIVGARNYYEKIESKIHPGNSYVINLLNQFNDHIKYFTGEGILQYRQSNSALVNKCSAIASQSHYPEIQAAEQRVKLMDSLIFTQNDYPCITISGRSGAENDDILQADKISADFVYELIKQITTQ